jgi:hypothetical protein
MTPGEEANGTDMGFGKGSSELDWVKVCSDILDQATRVEIKMNIAERELFQI